MRTLTIDGSTGGTPPPEACALAPPACSWAGAATAAAGTAATTAPASAVDRIFVTRLTATPFGCNSLRGPFLVVCSGQERPVHEARSAGARNRAARAPHGDAPVPRGTAPSRARAEPRVPSPRWDVSGTS